MRGTRPPPEAAACRLRPRSGPTPSGWSRLVAGWLVLFGAAACLASLAGCSDSGSPTPPASRAALLAPGAYGVATRDFEVVDTARATPPNGTFAGAPERRLPVRVWYPIAKPTRGAGAPTQGEAPPPGESFPVIAYAHGFLSSMHESVELKNHLVSHGYIVAAPNFPLSTAGAPGGPTLGDLPNQPGDLAFVLSRLESSDGPAPDLAAAIDTSRRGIAGLSLGGGTVLLAAYHPVLHLEGIRAAVAFAPVSCFFGDALYSRSLPTLIVAGDADELVPIDTGPVLAFAAAPPPALLVRLAGGNHVGFLGIDIPGVENSDTSVGCAAVTASDPARGTAQLEEGLTRGTVPEVTNPNGCDGGVCARHFRQQMRGVRQAELARLVTLAHFEAVLRDRRDAAAFLRETLAQEDADVELSVKD